MSSILPRVNYSVMQHPGGVIMFMLLAMIENDDVCLDEFTPSVSKAAVQPNLQSQFHVANKKKKAAVTNPNDMGHPLGCVQICVC